MKFEKLKPIEYHNLLDSEIFEIGWFPKRLEPHSIEVVKSMTAYEIRIKDLEDNDQKYDAAVIQLENIFWELSERFLGGTFLVTIEHKTFPKSRIRSFKGLFPYKGVIKSGEYKEYEFENKPGLSFFMVIIPITEENKRECFKLAKDSMRSFWVGPKSNREILYSLDFLTEIQKYLNIKGTIIIDYMRLVPALCNENNTVITFGQDTRGEYINLRIFCRGKIEIENLDAVI